MPYILYRAIRRMEAGLGDFWSDFAHGEAPVPAQLRDPLRWAGISMFDDQAVARETASRWVQGRYLAELHVPDEAAVVVRQTGRDVHHFSVMGTPATLRSLVARVLPIR